MLQDACKGMGGFFLFHSSLLPLLVLVLQLRDSYYFLQKYIDGELEIPGLLECFNLLKLLDTHFKLDSAYLLNLLLFFQLFNSSFLDFQKIGDFLICIKSKTKRHSLRFQYCVLFFSLESQS